MVRSQGYGQGLGHRVDILAGKVYAALQGLPVIQHHQLEGTAGKGAGIYRRPVLCSVFRRVVGQDSEPGRLDDVGIGIGLHPGNHRPDHSIAAGLLQAFEGCVPMRHGPVLLKIHGHPHHQGPAVLLFPHDIDPAPAALPERDLEPFGQSLRISGIQTPWKAGDGRNVDELTGVGLVIERHQPAGLPLEAEGHPGVGDLNDFRVAGAAP